MRKIWRILSSNLPRAYINLEKITVTVRRLREKEAEKRSGLVDTNFNHWTISEFNILSKYIFPQHAQINPFFNIIINIQFLSLQNTAHRGRNSRTR